jgi:hypothetical protein
MKQWQYRIVPIRLQRAPSGQPSGEEVLNNFGRQGWELISLSPHQADPTKDDRTLVVVLKRLIDNSN